MISNIIYGKYKLIKLLGSGGYGEVHLALNQEDNKEYAIKIMNKNKIINQNLDDNIKTEVKLMWQIKHPYIVKLIEVMATSKKILLVMEFMEGGDLFDFIKSQHNSRILEDKARLYFQQIIMGLDYCHKYNILHRDLKPENILVDKKNNCIKISDFGLAQTINSKDELISDVAGTTSYLAPEVIKQTGYLGQSADIWSCGVILFNCVTGTFPFFSKEPNKILNVILEGKVTYPDYLSNDIIHLLKNIFVVNPKHRYNVEQIILHTWFQKNFEPVKGYLEKNKIYEIKILNETEAKNEIQSVDSFINPNDIQIISCFELAAMISGNYLTNMFNKNKNSQNNFDKIIFKFITFIELDEALHLTYSFLNKNDNEIEFVPFDKSKLFVNILTKKKIQFQFMIVIYKITKRKLLFTFSHTKGDKLNFQKMMKSFFEENKIYFSLF